MTQAHRITQDGDPFPSGNPFQNVLFGRHREPREYATTPKTAANRGFPPPVCRHVHEHRDDTVGLMALPKVGVRLARLNCRYLTGGIQQPVLALAPLGQVCRANGIAENADSALTLRLARKHHFWRHERDVCTCGRLGLTCFGEPRFGKQEERFARTGEQGTSLKQLVEHVDVGGRVLPLAFSECKFAVCPLKHDVNLQIGRAHV